MTKFALSAMVLFLVLGPLLACSDRAPGISPDPSKIHYPTGIAVHPSGKFLYITNSNFDLAYTGGTVMVFDTKEDPANVQVLDINGVKVERLTLKALQEATVEVGTFSGQMVLSQAGDRAYIAMRQDKIAGSLATCQSNEGCPDSVNEECVRSRCRLRRSIESSSIISLRLDTSKTGAGHLLCDSKSFEQNETGGVGEEAKFDLTPAPRCGDKSKLFLRDNPFPFGLKLVRQCEARRACEADDGCKCDEAAKEQGLCDADQRCDFGRCVDGCKADSDCKQGESCSLGRCRTSQPQGKACAKDSECARGERCDQSKCAPGCAKDADCAQGLVCTEGRCRTPLAQTFCGETNTCARWEACVDKRLLASHLATGGISDISLPKGGWEDLDETAKTQLRKVKGLSLLPQSTTAIEVLTSGGLGGTGEVLLSSRSVNKIFVLPPNIVFGADTNVEVPFIHSSQSNTSSGDLRGMAVVQDPKSKQVRLFVANRNPDALLVYALTRPEPGGDLQANLINTVPVGLDPSQLLFRRGRLGWPDRLYVVCSGDNRIDVLDPHTMRVVDQIKVGQQPYFMTIYEPSSRSDEVQHRRAYVANFLDTSVSIIDLDRSRVIGLIQGVNTKIVVRP